MIHFVMQKKRLGTFCEPCEHIHQTVNSVDLKHKKIYEYTDTCLATGKTLRYLLFAGCPRGYADKSNAKVNIYCPKLIKE